MQKFLEIIQNDSSLMLFTLIALIVFMVIVLVVIISSMRIKTYKNRYWNIEIDNKEKIAYIEQIEEDLQAYKIQNASDTQSLLQFDETKEILKSNTEDFLLLQGEYNEREKELSQVRAKLEGAESLYILLSNDYKELQSHNRRIQEENNKSHINNARLLMKIENESRNASAQAELMHSHKQEIKRV
ncbi:MAG: type II secretion system protein [Sulfurovum sp.]|nr:type II secretion system protein [Sulfurovum sp.]